VKPKGYGEAFATADDVLRSVASALGLGVPRLRFGGTDPGQVARALDEASAAVVRLCMHGLVSPRLRRSL